VFATVAAGVALIVNQPLSHAVDRLRPYVTHPATAHLLIARAHDPSFPSDHATGGFALACGMFLYDRTIGAVLFALAAVLAFARVYVGTHYPGDVAAGAAIGTLWALLLLISPVRRRLERVALAFARLWDRLLEHPTRRRAIRT
jgi:membrane-associated phospholipid phosphatase